MQVSLLIVNVHKDHVEFVLRIYLVVIHVLVGISDY